LRRGVILGVISVALVFAVGCRTKIGQILSQPELYKGKQVVVVGEVARRLPIPFFETAGYQLKDESGTIWVITRRAFLPEVGRRYKVTGIVEAGIRVGPREFGLVISEQKKEELSR